MSDNGGKKPEATPVKLVFKPLIHGNVHERKMTYEIDTSNTRDLAFHRALCILTSNPNQQTYPADVQLTRFVKAVNVVLVLSINTVTKPFSSLMDVEITYLAADMYDIPVLKDVLSVETKPVGE